MSKPIQAINRYKADLRELNFLLFEQFRLDELLGKAPFSAWGRDECDATLAGCYRWVREVIGPLNTPGDAEACRLEDGRVITPRGFKEAWKSLYEAGWKQLAVEERWGGAGAPHAIQVLVEEMISGANTAFG
ncbi:MAG: acyl-CoA dehydrogenase N-terminal domain-containing protein, partial [Myxococcales bacterium]|nr:acyl-CoA dehydrogenase N-terminal domain-containing protein [Myxococcales bacterium]